MIDLKLILFVSSPILLLALISIFRDRFEQENKTLRLHNWSLIPAIFLITVFISGEVIAQSFWNYIPILKNITYNQLNWDIVTLSVYSLLIISSYLLLRYVYSVSIIEVFKLKLNQFPFILKLCAVLIIINTLSIYFFDLNLMLNPQMSDLEAIKLMDIKGFILYSFVTVIIAPVAEESIFRGLLYSPLYRKVGRCLAIIISSLLLTHGHFMALLPSIAVFIVGLFLGWLYDRSGSLLHPIIFHMFKNSWIIYYFF